MSSTIHEDIDQIIDSLGQDAHLLEGETVLLSGGAGFLGLYIVALLKALNAKVLAKPCNIVVLDNFITGMKDNVMLREADPNLLFIEHDVRRPLPPYIEARYLLHAAGIASPAYYQQYPLETIEVAVQGTKNFLELARKNNAKSVVVFSSSEIYGDPEPSAVPTPETYWGNVSSMGPRACYDESKRLGETLCTIYSRLYDVPVKIVRPFNVFGPGMKTNDYRVIPTFVSQGLSGKPLTIHDNGNQTRTFCYVSDAIEGVFRVLLLGKNGEAYNVGTDRDEINMVALAERRNQVLPAPVDIKFINYPDSYPAGEPRRRSPDLTKIRQLGYTPKVSVMDGLTRTVAWYRELLGV